MTIYGTVLPGAASIARSAFLAGNLSAQAQHRLKVLDWHRAHEHNVSLTARHFGVTRETIIAWRDRLTREGPRGLEDRSRRPHRMRQPTVRSETVVEVVKLRRQYPAWSKYKIKPLLPDHLTTSVTTVGRILRRRGLINQKVSRKRQKTAQHPKRRFPKGFVIRNPGDMVQMDTKHLVLIGGRKLYQFTAIDVLTKRRVLHYYPSLASKNGAAFLRHCLMRFPFPLQAVQTDNGSEFLGAFDRLCQELGLPHYFIYPRTPKQNTYVEISHGADEREWYRYGRIYADPARMHQELEGWERIWNTIRPHQALNYLTPHAYFEKWQRGQLPTRDTIILQA